MRIIRIALTLVLSIVVFNLQAQIQKKQSEVAVEGSPQITFKEKSHDFGTIKEGEVVETVFEFSNTGNAPLIISKIKASCGCTVPSNWSKEPIQPGEESSFSVKFNSTNKPNRQSKTVTINSNAGKGVDNVTIKLMVTPDPEKEALRKAQAEKRKEHYRLQKEKAALKEKQNDAQIATKDKAASSISLADHKKQNNHKTKIEKERKQTEVATKKMSKEREGTEKEIKKLEKERKRIEKETKKLEKANDKAEKAKKAKAKELKKATKKATKEKKKAAKKAKKLAKKEVKIEKAANAVSDRESKIAKLVAKMKKTETQGDLSPNDKLDYENKIAKLTNKLEKEKKVLEKLQN